MQTKVTQLLDIRLPIVQGGLAYLAYSRLAAAVSNAGGLGQITAMTLGDPEGLRNEIKKVRGLTDKPFGVNFAIGQHGRPYEDLLEVAIAEEVPVISMTGGNPAPLLDRLSGTKIRKLVLVATVRQAQKAEACGADAVMVVGQEGGGHIGRDDIGTIVLIPKVVQSVGIPVIASGGIVDGRGMAAALLLGAEGIEMGTRFIATQECEHAHQEYKEHIINASELDTVVIKRSLGAPGRALRSAFTEGIIAQEEQGAGYEELKDKVSGEANKNYIYAGKSDEGFAWAGQGIGLINDIPTVEELLQRIEREAREAIVKGMQMFNA